MCALCGGKSTDLARRSPTHHNRVRLVLFSFSPRRCHRLLHHLMTFSAVPPFYFQSNIPFIRRILHLSDVFDVCLHIYPPPNNSILSRTHGQWSVRHAKHEYNLPKQPSFPVTCNHLRSSFNFIQPPPPASFGPKYST